MKANTLERLAETLRRGVLTIVCAPSGTDIEVHDVVIHDPADKFDATDGDLVLGVGLEGADEATTVISDLARRGAAGLVLKSPWAIDPEITRAAEKAGLALISVPNGASWAQIVQLIGSVISQGSTAADEVHGLAAGDLFALADAIAELVDAPITIEDRLSRVLAYSARQDEADPARAETIVGRRVPTRFQQVLEERGVFRRLETERGCHFIDQIGDGILPRLAVSVRAGDEILGSIWAAVQQRPSAEVERAFADTAKLATLHLLRHRAGADVERSLQADLLASILQGTAGATDAAFRLELASSAYRVVAVALSSEEDTAGVQSRALRDVLAVHLSTFRVKGAAASLGGIVYGLIATDEDEQRSEELALRICEDLAQRSPQLGLLAIGVGCHGASLEEVPRSKREAEEALRVLRKHPRKRVASFNQVRLQALVARFTEAAATERDIYEQKIVPLLSSDREKGTGYVAALDAFLDEFGDYTAAAARLHIHANTLRYRLKKAQELAGVDLADAEERLALMLLLRLVRGPD